MKKLLTITLLSLFIFPSLVSAQKTIQEAYIKYEITDVKSDDPQMEAALNMMKGSTMEIYFNSGKQRAVVDMMGGMVKMNTINNVENKETVMLMDMMGRKIKVKGTEEEFKQMNDQNTPDPEEIKKQITYNKSKTKTIAGYPCYEAVFKMPQDENTGMDMTLTAYVTDKIVSPKSVIRNMETVELQGLPLEYTIGASGFSMTYTAVQVDEKVDEKSFEIPDGYEEMTIDQFMETMGAMGGGMGF